MRRFAVHAIVGRWGDVRMQVDHFDIPGALSVAFRELNDGVTPVKFIDCKEISP